MDGVEWKSRMADVRERVEAVQLEAEAKLLNGERESFIERLRFSAPYVREIGSCAFEIVKLIPHIPEAAISETRRKRDFQ